MCECVWGSVGGWSCQYFLRCNFLAEWQWGPLLWKSLRVSGVKSAHWLLKSVAIKARRRQWVHPHSPHLQSFFLTLLRGQSTAQFSSVCTYVFFCPVLTFPLSFSNMSAFHYVDVCYLSFMIFWCSTHTFPLCFCNLHQWKMTRILIIFCL